MFRTTNDLGENLRQKFEKRYSNYKFAIFTEKFDDLDSMKKALRDDVNSTSNKLCGKFMGKVVM